LMRVYPGSAPHDSVDAVDIGLGSPGTRGSYWRIAAAVCEYDSDATLPAPTPTPTPPTLESICSAIQARIRANVNPRLIARVFPDSAGLEGRRR
jgi:hypothetical protein